MSGFRRISVDEAELLIQQPNVLLLDVRDARSFCAGHCPGALHLHDGNLRKLLKNTPTNVSIVIYCYHGNASQDMAQLFFDFGFQHSYSVDGGYEAWRQTLSPPQTPLSDALQAWLRAQGFDTGNLDARRANNETALMRAARTGAAAALAELIAAGASLNAKNADGNSALWFACFYGDEALVQQLIDAGADLNNQNDNGATALIYAASAAKTAIVRRLVDAGAALDRTTLDDFTALDVAADIATLRYLRAAAEGAAACLH